MITIPAFQKFSKVRLTSVTVVALCIITGGAYALHTNTTQHSTIASANTTTTHHNVQKPVATTTPSSTDTSSAVEKPSSVSTKTASKSSNTVAAQTTPTPNNSTALPVATVVPITPSNYTPTPSFNLSLHADQGYTTTYPTIPNYAYFNIPYSLSYDPNFAAVTVDSPSCNFISGPALTDIWCNVSEKGSVLSIQYDNATVAGNYVVQMSYTMNGVTRTDTASFDVQ